MMKLSSDIQKEIMKFLFSPESAEDMSDALAKPYISRIRNVVEKEGYNIIAKDANVRMMKNKNNSVFLEISTVGDDNEGAFISVSMESFDGAPFKSITIFNEEMDEIETLEI